VDTSPTRTTRPAERPAVSAGAPRTSHYRYATAGLAAAGLLVTVANQDVTRGTAIYVVLTCASVVSALAGLACLSFGMLTRARVTPPGIPTALTNTAMAAAPARPARPPRSVLGSPNRGRIALPARASVASAAAPSLSGYGDGAAAKPPVQA
jgi:hypothetical protein